MYNLYYSSHDFTESKADCFVQTLTNFMATSLNPFCSNRLMMSAISPLWTASGLSIRNVRSLFPSPSPDIFKRELYALSSKPLYAEPVESLKATYATWAVNIYVTMPNQSEQGGAGRRGPGGAEILLRASWHEPGWPGWPAFPRSRLTSRLNRCVNRRGLARFLISVRGQAGWTFCMIWTLQPGYWDEFRRFGMA